MPADNSARMNVSRNVSAKILANIVDDSAQRAWKKWKKLEAWNTSQKDAWLEAWRQGRQEGFEAGYSQGRKEAAKLGGCGKEK